MKSEPCDKYKKTIEQYTCGELNSGETEKLLEHIKQCAVCRAYLDALNSTEQAMGQWIESLEPLLETGQAETVSRFRQMPEPRCRAAGLSGCWRWAGYAAAACILIVAGFLAGRGQGSLVDIDELARMENRITGSVVDTLRPEIVGEYAKIQDALSDQITLQLTNYAEQTVLRNDLQTYNLLTQLIEAIQAAQVHNQQWALSAMQELESHRLLDQEKVRSEFAAFATYTGNELLRTQQAVQALSTEQK